MATLRDGETVSVQGSGAKPYELKRSGDVYSCTCPAWRNQKAPLNKRTCKHLKKLLGAVSEEDRTAQTGAHGIKQVYVRSEGDTNCDWEVTFSDGRVHRWYSIDHESPQDGEDGGNDERLYDVNAPLAEFLQELWYSMGLEEDYDNPTIHHAIFDGTGRMIRSWDEPAG